jgi:predicted RNase H-like nuclease (RuvC/YqgF family)
MAKDKETEANSTDVLEALKAENASLKSEIEAKDTIIQALEAELATTKTQVVGAAKIGTLGGKKYRAAMPMVNHKGTIYKTEEILENEELLAVFVAKGSGAVEEVTDEE